MIPPYVHFITPAEFLFSQKTQGEVVVLAVKLVHDDDGLLRCYCDTYITRTVLKEF